METNCIARQNFSSWNDLYLICSWTKDWSICRLLTRNINLQLVIEICILSRITWSTPTNTNTHTDGDHNYNANFKSRRENENDDPFFFYHQIDNILISLDWSRRISGSSSLSHGNWDDSFFRTWRITIQKLDFCTIKSLILKLPSSIIFGAIMVKIPSGDIVDVTVSGFTPWGMVTRRRNLIKKNI